MTKPIPDGFHTVTPHLTVTDGAKAIEFYKKAFDAREIDRHLTPDGKQVLHAQIRIGDSMIMIGGEMPPECLAPKNRGGTTVGIYLYLDNADRAFDRAVKAGCRVKMPVADQFWGDRCGQVEDLFGHQWTLATHKQDLTKEQIAAGAKDFFARMSKQPERELAKA